MASIRAAGLGPIIGHTTDTTCRIWIRAGDPGDQGILLDPDRRTVGIIGLVEGTAGTPRIGETWYFRLPREYDRTGTFVLGFDTQLGLYHTDFEEQGVEPPAKLPSNAVPTPLKPDTDYLIRVGTLTIDDPMPEDESLPDWELLKRLPDIDNIKQELLLLPDEASVGVFRTFKSPDAAADDDLAFLIGSCRYPGLLWKIKDADRIFGPMITHFSQDKTLNPLGPVRLTAMCGDQIYADALNKNVPLMRADTFKEFQDRYVTAFGAPNLRRLLRGSTTYMILDDHEIEDNWSQDKIKEPKGHQLFNIAIGAYLSYQWSHGPRTWGRLLYYSFQCGAYPFFVIDTRTQRYKDDAAGIADNHLLGRPNIDPAFPGQLNRLLDWLIAQQKQRGNIPKFIVSSAVFAPNGMDERLAPAPGEKGPVNLLKTNLKRREASDSWPAFPTTRQAILECIIRNKIQNVVFLSGDIHCANVAEISFDGPAAAKKLKAFNVTSSAFYWPFPFAVGDPNAYVHDSRRKDQSDPFPVGDTGATMHYRSYGYTQEDNFCRLDVDRDQHALTIRLYDRKGKPITVMDFDGQEAETNVVRLAEW